jgi:NNP family nitrate/nitrite transporter-like MFS transporter
VLNLSAIDHAETNTAARTKWWILALTSLASIATYMNWLNFTPLALPIMSEFNLNYTEFGFLVTSAMILPIIAQFGSGILADKFGGERVMALFLILIFIPAFLTGFSADYGQLLVLRIFIGLAASVFVVGSRIISIHFEKERMGFAQGIFGGSTIAGLALSAFIMPHVSETLGVRLSFMASALLMFPFLIIFVFLALRGRKNNTRAKTKLSFSVLKSPITWYISWLNFGFFGMYTGATSWLPSYFSQEFTLGIVLAGGFSAVGLAIGAFMRPMGGYTGDKIKSIYLLPSATILAAFFYLLIGLKINVWVSFASFILLSAIIMFGAGALFRLPPLLFPAEVGTVVGFASTFGLLLGGFILPPIEGFTIDATSSYSVVFFMLAALSLINTIAAIKIGKVMKKR